MKRGQIEKEDPHHGVGLPLPGARERVLNYVRAELLGAGLAPGTRLPTIRHLARRLDVSDRTVQSAFQELSRLGLVRSRVGRGTFVTSPPDSGKREHRIALGIPARPSAPYDVFLNRLCGSVVTAAAAGLPALSLVAHGWDDPGHGSIVAQLLDERADVDGLILFPMTIGERIRLAYEQSGKTVVSINPPSDFATANFVSPDYFESARRAAEVWRQTGRRNLLLLTGFPLEQSPSSRLRRFGLETGLGESLLRGDATLRVLAAGMPSYTVEAGHRAMGELLAGETVRPDAMFCMSDYLALGARQAALEAGLRVPDDISIVGGSGVDLSTTDCPALTRTVQPLEAIGEAAVAMMRRLLDTPNGGERAVPARFFPTPFIGGATTRPEENKRLRIG